MIWVLANPNNSVQFSKEQSFHIYKFIEGLLLIINNSHVDVAEMAICSKNLMN